MPSETVLFFPNKIQELWSELRREFTAEQSCFKKIFLKWASLKVKVLEPLDAITKITE